MKGAENQGVRMPFRLDTPEGEIRLRGRVDRIDRNPLTGELMIYDYKTGRGASRSDVLAGRSLQLAIYIMAAEQYLGTVSGAAYLSISEGSATAHVVRRGRAESLGWSSRIRSLEPQEWDNFLDGARNGVAACVKGITEGDFAPRPLTCRGCRVAAACFYRPGAGAAEGGADNE